MTRCLCDIRHTSPHDPSSRSTLVLQRAVKEEDKMRVIDHIEQTGWVPFYVKGGRGARLAVK